MNSIVFRIKQQGTPALKLCFRSAQALLRLSLPVNRATKPFFKVLYSLHVVIREALILAVKALYYEPLFRSQCVAVGDAFMMENLPYIVGSGKITIGDNVRLSGKPSIGFSNKINHDPELIIGNHTFIGHNTSFAIAASVKIGNDCLIAGGVTIMDNDGHPVDHIKRRRGLPPDPESVKPVTIGNDVWIGKMAVILKGVTIGDRAIIGSRAVVSKSVPDDGIVVGNPGRLL